MTDTVTACAHQRSADTDICQYMPILSPIKHPRDRQILIVCPAGM